MIVDEFHIEEKYTENLYKRERSAWLGSSIIHGIDRTTSDNEARERTKERKKTNKISTPAVKYFHTEGNSKFRFPDKTKYIDINEKTQ